MRFQFFPYCVGGMYRTYVKQSTQCTRVHAAHLCTPSSHLRVSIVCPLLSVQLPCCSGGARVRVSLPCLSSSLRSCEFQCVGVCAYRCLAMACIVLGRRYEKHIRLHSTAASCPGEPAHAHRQKWRSSVEVTTSGVRASLHPPLIYALCSLLGRMSASYSLPLSSCTSPRFVACVGVGCRASQSRLTVGFDRRPRRLRGCLFLSVRRVLFVLRSCVCLCVCGGGTSMIAWVGDLCREHTHTFALPLSLSLQFLLYTSSE